MNQFIEGINERGTDAEQSMELAWGCAKRFSYAVPAATIELIVGRGRASRHVPRAAQRGWLIFDGGGEVKKKSILNHSPIAE